MLNYYRISDPSDVRDLGEQMAAWELADNPKRNDWAVQPAAPSADAVWADGAWSVPPVATFTAEEHLESVGLGGNRQPTLLYLRQAGAVSPKLDATEQYLNTILGMFAADPAPRSDWTAPAYTFEETVTQAVQSLSQPSEPSAPSANFA
jgi:hypothetical protein